MNRDPSLHDESLRCGSFCVSFNRAAGSLLWVAAGLGRHADRQGTRLDLSEESRGLPDNVAIELVVLLPVDHDPHPLSRALVDLIILLGASGDEP